MFVRRGDLNCERLRHDYLQRILRIELTARIESGITVLYALMRPILTTVVASLVAAFTSGAAGPCANVSSPLLARAAQSAGAGQSTAATKKSPANATAQSSDAARVARGKKLVLKDGSYQLIREYELKGDRVRYFSTERGQWEEIPVALVDWEATKKAESAEEKTDEALLKKVENQEAATHAQTPIDVDASLLVAPGVFLPDGEGMFAIEGKSVKRIAQVGSDVKTDKKTVLKQVLTPIPIIASKRNVEIPGTRAAVRLTTGTPEFYLRSPLPDADESTGIERSSRLGDAAPEVVLVRAKIKGNKRLLESLRSYFGQDVGQERQEIGVQRWDVAPDVYRFTLSEQLTPGEYALAEILPGGMNLFVWDFAVDAPQQATQTGKH